MQPKDLLKLVFELGVQSRTPRNGPYHVGITNQLTAAAHSYRAMALAYFMAHEENADAGKVLKMCLVNDMPESRILDNTFIQKKYFDAEEAAPAALRDQLRGMKGSVELVALHKELSEGKSLEANIAAEAGKLETLIEAKEEMQKGNMTMQRWFLEKEKEFATKTGKELFSVLQKEDIFWWQD